MTQNLSCVPFVNVRDMTKLIAKTGIETCLAQMTAYIEEDFRRWQQFHKAPRVASHSADGVIELMPTTDGRLYSFKYVNGHPQNTRAGRQTVVAFGALADVATGYPILLSEMTLLTALRTAATSALAAKYLAPSGADCMAIIGNGAQAEFQALAFKAVLRIRKLRLYDIDPAATAKCARNLAGAGLQVVACGSMRAALDGAQIVTTATADKQNAVILADELIAEGVHINAIGGDCPGKTELHRDLLLRSDIFVEYLPQTRVEGELQHLPANHPATELWRVVLGRATGRSSSRQISVFDSVGFAIEDFSALRYVRDRLAEADSLSSLDLLAAPANPRNLFGILLDAQSE